MKNEKISCPPLDRGFNKLAQSGTGSEKTLSKSKITVRGNGSRPLKLLHLQNRAQKKTITQRIMRELIPVALNKGEMERYYSYQNTLSCQNQIITANGRMYGTYCKNRYCEICLSIRKFEKVNKYYPVISRWSCPYFLTLTQKSIRAERLQEKINEMFEAFEIIKGKYKKRNQRGKGIKLIGVKSLESNFNHFDRTYNPHFHFILPDFQTADTLRTEWINYWGDKRICEPYAQHNKKIENVAWQLRETIKYGTKFLSKEKVDKKTGKIIPPLICIAALDNIFSAMKNHRLFDRFGFVLPKPEKPDTKKSITLTEFREWNYYCESCDWVDDENGERISRYIPPPKLTAYLENNINTDLE